MGKATEELRISSFIGAHKKTCAAIESKRGLLSQAAAASSSEVSPPGRAGAVTAAVEHGGGQLPAGERGGRGADGARLDPRTEQFGPFGELQL